MRGSRPSSVVSSSSANNTLRRGQSSNSFYSQQSTGFRRNVPDPRASKQWEAFANPPDGIHHPRRGLFLCSQLLACEEARQLEEEFINLERICVVRFPPDIAEILRTRLAHDMTIELNTKLLGDNKPGENPRGLGLTIVPTTDEDFRRFEVYIEMELGNPDTAKKLYGILVELPALLEIYKSLEAELMFKSADVSQMLYVYYPEDSKADEIIQKIKHKQGWEWHSGLTPGTHRIRYRKFRNWRVFEKADIAIAERAICDVIRQGGQGDTLTIEAATEEIMECHLLAVTDNCRNQLILGNEEGLVGIIGPQNPIFIAANEGKPPSAVEGPMDRDDMKLMRNICANAHNLKMSLPDLLKYSFDPNAPLINPDQPIPDNLEDILFGELPQTTGPDGTTYEAGSIEDIFSLDELGQLNGESDDSSAASSIGAIPRKKKKKRKKSSSDAGQLVAAGGMPAGPPQNLPPGMSTHGLSMPLSSQQAALFTQAGISQGMAPQMISPAMLQSGMIPPGIALPPGYLPIMQMQQQQQQEQQQQEQQQQQHQHPQQQQQGPPER